jgi:hypothetical protein
MARGHFQEVHQRALDGLPKALQLEHPALMAMNLGDIATCYYTRGAVALLDGDRAGWHDIQCGYSAALYDLRFELKAVTLPAWSTGRVFSGASQVELVLTLGLAKLFRQESDASWLLSAVDARFNTEDALGTKIDDGTLLLDSILGTDEGFSYADLLKDRKQCCKKRDAWPKRPTEIRPFGVLDIEAMLCFPQESSFQYSNSTEFKPTEEKAVAEAVTAFENWYG